MGKTQADLSVSPVFAGEEDKALARRKRRISRRENIKNRPITIICKRGLRFTGWPVVGNEWEALSDNEKAICFETYDTGGGVCPKEAFIVSKRRSSGRVRKTKVVKF